MRGVIPSLRRGYATKYTGKVVTSTNKGRFSAIEVSVTPPTLVSDVRGYPLPRRGLIVEATKLLQSKSAASSPDPFLDLSEYLQALNVPPTTSEVSEILKALKSPTLALEFFHFCRSHIPNFRHDAFTYNRILLILSKSSLPDRIDKMKEIIDLMERLRTVGNISTVNILIGAFNSVEGLEKCLELLKKWDLQLTCYTYKCLLQAYLRANDLNRAVQIYEKIRRKGYVLDSFAYNMLLDALAKDEKVDQAYKVFEDMKRKYCKPDEFTYTILIRMNGRLGKLKEAVALFEEMVSKDCKPNSMAYNTMIEALVRGRMSDKAMTLFSKMVEDNCRPNEFTYSLILNVLAAEGQLGRMDEVVKISSKYMNKSIYAFLVRTLSKLGHASEAHWLFCNMWSFHDKGDRDAYLSMLESLCNAGKVTEAIDMLSRTHEKGIITDTFMYNTVFSALGKSKQVVHLLDLYEKMKLDGPTPDIFTYNILISSFGRAGRVEEAVRIFEELENSDFRPDVVSYNSLINCLGKNGNLDEAHMRLKEMQEKGLNPDVVTYSTLIECFGKTDKVEMAYSLFDEMLAEGCCPNIITYNILLDCLEKSGRSAEAVDLYSKLKEQGLTPDSITYAILERLQSGSQRKHRIRKQNPITGWVVSPLSIKSTKFATKHTSLTHIRSLQKLEVLRFLLFLPILLQASLAATAAAAEPYALDTIQLLRPRSGSNGRLVEGLDCLSWRLAVETNNLQGWTLVPLSCEDYVGNYMLGKQYRRDCEVAAAAAIDYAKSVEVAGDGKDVWVFDIDETTLSNLPYYARSDVRFGATAYNDTKFGEWVEEGKAPALPSILRLYTTVESLGFKTVIISGTAERFRDIKIVNLNKAGYYNWEKLILKEESEHGTSVEYKSKKRTELVNEGYRIVGNIGDQWSHLIGSNGGNRTFKVPDPMYYIG